MEIHEEDDDFVDDRYADMQENADDEDLMEDDIQVLEDRNNKKAKGTTTTTAADVEMLDANKQEKKLPLIEKYRPATLEDVVAQDDIVKTITKLMEKNALPHLLLYGPPGTGKT